MGFLDLSSGEKGVPAEMFCTNKIKQRFTTAINSNVEIINMHELVSPKYLELRLVVSILNCLELKMNLSRYFFFCETDSMYLTKTGK